MRDAQPRATLLQDYSPPAYLIDRTELHFLIEPGATTVRSRLHMRRNPAATGDGTSLVLDGCNLRTLALAIDERPLTTDDYLIDGEQMTIASVPERFALEVVTEIEPEKNRSLEGLYRSRTMYCTQCEAEGFRHITWFLDRPDVMSVYTVTIEADRAQCPVLLSNGNLVAQGEAGGGRHWARWEDPFPKPSYLFALVAGDLDRFDDRFTTCSGHEVSLHIYVEPQDLDKCQHAMHSLKRAMRWDEKVYGREYDLDIFNIVAVDDFNMGAMENKSLNIFNTSCVLAKPETTTDAGFQRVEAVVAHEYFHNWSGNRVTCRDWFQLSLKEGFTVFRDAQFSADMGSATVKRIEDATLLRTVQFAEDAGPLAHPVRPESYIEISNFYTVTIYEKGAEVVRMLHTLLGAEDFRRGSDLYFARHDGQAVTCDDFVRAMEDASGRDLGQFRRWYSQAGTPQVTAIGNYDADTRRYSLTLRQHCPPTPGQPHKEPLLIPIRLALIGAAGALPLNVRGSVVDFTAPDRTEVVVALREAEQRLEFENVTEAPVPSLLRGFSAPVKLQHDYDRDQLQRLMRLDSDGFSRWDAGQQLAVQVLQALIADEAAAIDPRLIDAYRAIMADDSLDPALLALMLALPSEAYLSELATRIDPLAIHRAREQLSDHLAAVLSDAWWRLYRDHSHSEPYQPSATQIGGRALKNTALQYLMRLETPDILHCCEQQFQTADNMTDTLAAFSALVNSSAEEARAAALDSFYQRWQHEPLVVNLWLQVQAGCRRPGTLATVLELMQHPAFDRHNPNKLRALIGAFCSQNAINFHQPDGQGYRFLADQIIALDASNPQMASRFLTPLTRWRRYIPQAATLMREELGRIMAESGLSRDVYEVVSKSLAEDPDIERRKAE